MNAEVIFKKDLFFILQNGSALNLQNVAGTSCKMIRICSGFPDPVYLFGYIAMVPINDLHFKPLIL